jgi:hypothetical protein
LTCDGLSGITLTVTIAGLELLRWQRVTI